MATFLIIEDEFIIAEDIRKSIEKLGHKVIAIATNGKDGIIKTTDLKPDIVMIDILLNGDIDGIETAGMIKKKCNIPIIFCTAFTDKDTRSKAMKMNPISYIVKPFTTEELENSVIALTKKGSKI